ncbi:MAG TPA: TRAP transporter large permease [Bacillota bacterium]|nr:TRAP transporter large permease [Bacillota bacterium]
MAYGFFAFFITMLAGIPVGFGLGIGSLVTLLVKGYSLSTIAARMFTGVDNFPIMAIPFFCIAGDLMSETGITQRLVKFADTLVGHIRGGLGHVNVVAECFFSGITGSAIADASALGSMLIPSMVEKGFDVGFSAAVVASASVIGPIIPPSIPFVVYGLITGVSVGGLFMAGMVPGIVLAIGLMIVIYIISIRRGYPANSRRATVKEVLVATYKALVALAMPMIILGGIMAGIFTATEASAVAVMYALFIGFVVFRNLDIKKIPRLLINSSRTMGIVFLVMATANIFNWLMAIEQVPQKVALALTSQVTSPALLLLIINAVLLVLGCFMEGTAAMILTVPIILEIMKGSGVHPIMLGIIVVLNLMIGLITPPLGLSLYVSCSMAKISLDRISKQIWPFVLVEVIVLLLVTYIEPISMWLPRLTGFAR